MILSRKHRFGFVHIHKTAGESITEALYPHLGPDDVVLGSWRLGAFKNLYIGQKLGLSKHSSAGEIRDFAGDKVWQSYFTFSFVRHPIDRARSRYKFYSMMLQRRKRWTFYNLRQPLPFFRRNDPLRWPGMQAYRDTSSFSEFIRHPGFQEDQGFRSQCDMLLDADGRLLVDFVGRHDQLERDFAEVVSRIGLPEIRLPQLNVSRSSNLKELVITEDDEALLRRLFAREFEVFGFDRNRVE